MASREYLRESVGAVAAPIVLIGTLSPADWIQAAAAGTIVLKDGTGTSVTVTAGAGDVFPGPVREITSSTGKIRYGTGPLPIPGPAAAASASAVAAAASAAAAASQILSVTLIAGTKTQASGGDLTSAKIVGAPRLSALNGTPALGSQILATISGNNVVLTAYGPTGAALITDVATYAVTLSGVL